MLSTADSPTFSTQPANSHDHPLKRTVFRGKSETPYLQHGLVLFSIIESEVGPNTTMDLSQSSCEANNTGQGTKGHFLKDMDSVTHFQEGERHVKFIWSFFEILGTGHGKATQVKLVLPAGGLLA